VVGVLWFGVWGLGFGVWGLGFGVWGLGGFGCRAQDYYAHLVVRDLEHGLVFVQAAGRAVVPVRIRLAHVADAILRQENRTQG